jgi:hypothetical protein
LATYGLLDRGEAANRALEIIKERIGRQYTDHVTSILADYNKIFLNDKKTKEFLDRKLKGEKVNLVTLHHSLYYCEEEKWDSIFENLYKDILASKGAIHAVLMSAASRKRNTTTWLYNHFVGKFFGHHNDQDLLRLRKKLKKYRIFKKARILPRTNYIKFFVEDFEKFMAVIWMIMLYPNVHQYTDSQKEEITEFVYKKIWKKKKPLIQPQDHVVVYRGIKGSGLI